tara:strand:+ start:152 stop:565 length:414 start_codon:yes stop_codon:yes gene_type:complete
MKKSELKNIIKECVKEVIFEEGVLSSIITEVATGLRGTPDIPRHAAPAQQQKQSPQASQLTETKKQVLSAIGNDAYDHIKKKFKDPSLFEGTKPIPESRGNKGGVLSGVDPQDPGVDLSSIPGMGSWATIASTKGNR